MRVVDPASTLLTSPNRIAAGDWEQWVQERARCMPSEIDPRYRTPLAMGVRTRGVGLRPKSQIACSAVVA